MQRQGSPFACSRWLGNLLTYGSWCAGPVFYLLRPTCRGSIKGQLPRADTLFGSGQTRGGLPSLGMCHCGNPPALRGTDIIARIGDCWLRTTERAVDGEVLLCLSSDVIDHARPRPGSACDDPVDGAADDSSCNGLRCAHVGEQRVQRGAGKSIRRATMAGEQTQDFLPQASTQQTNTTNINTTFLQSSKQALHIIPTTTKPKPPP